MAITKRWNNSGYYVWAAPDNIVGPVEIQVRGGDGGRIWPGTGYYQGGAGGMVHGRLSINPGQQLYVRVGGAGGSVDATNGDGTTARQGGDAGYNGGGRGGHSSGAGGRGGAGGGGASDVRIGSQDPHSRIAVAGGGGGAATGNGTPETGKPAGGYRAGGRGGAVQGEGGVSGTAGGDGGTQTAGGSGGVPYSGASGSGYVGTFGWGGHGADTDVVPFAGGGGGAGYWGGGGGADADSTHSGGSGGGGSNYVGGLTTVIESVRGYQPVDTPRDGWVQLSWVVTPDAPTGLNTPDGNRVNGLDAVEVDWVFNSQDTADDQQSASVRWRVGGSAWTTIPNAASTATQYSFPAGTFTALLGQQIEWQVQAESAAAAAWSPWSTSAFFTPVAPPPSTFVFSSTPTITTQSPHVVGTRGDNGPIAAYQARILNSGGSVVLQTHEVVPALTVKTLAFDLPPYDGYVNGQSYNIQVKIAYPRGVWQTGWSDSGAIVASINAPKTPKLTITTDADSVTVTFINPSGGTGTDHNDLYRTGPDGAEIRIATGIPPNGSYTDPLVGFNRPWRYRGVAVSAGGATASST